jgi:adenine-specific DNA-methyltransferase
MPTLDFKGKPFVYSHHLSVPYRELIVDNGKSLPPKGQEPSLDDNLIIHGDNLEALKALLPRYAGKVDVIYIDPPYNTGNEGWAYNDNVNAPQLKEWLGKVVDAEDMERHEKWLCMMWPRLQLMKELLSNTGTIWVNLDDIEVHFCKCIMDEIFGLDRFVTSIVWKKMDSPSRNEKSRTFSSYHDYIMVFSNGDTALAQEYRPSIIDAYPLELEDGRRARRRQLRKNGKSARRTDRESMWYPLTAPDETVIYPIAPEGWEGRWTLSEKEWRAREKAGMTEWIKREYGWVPYYIETSPTDPTAPWSTIWEDVGQNRQAKAEIKQIFGSDVFETPKPTALIERVLDVVGDADALVLDSFAGSGTTGHAALMLNQRDGGSRKFILIQLPENIKKGTPAFTAGYRQVVDLTRERIRRALTGYNYKRKKKKVDVIEEVAHLPGSFTYCELGEPMDMERFFAEDGEAPAFDQVARYVAYTATGETLAPAEGPDGFAGHAGNYRLHLLYRPDAAWMRSNDAMLDLTTAERIADAAKADGRKPVLVFAAGKLMGQRVLTGLGLTFCQLPYSVHRILGDGTEGVAGVDAA